MNNRLEKNGLHGVRVIMSSDLNRVVSGFNVILTPHGAGGKSSTRERRATWGTKDDRSQCHDLTWNIYERWAWTEWMRFFKWQSEVLSLLCLVIRQQEHYEIQPRHTLFKCKLSSSACHVERILMVFRIKYVANEFFSLAESLPQEVSWRMIR